PNIKEEIAPDCAAAAPERRCPFGAVLMHEMVQEIAILGEPAGCSRPCVIGTKHRSKVRVGPKEFDEARKCVRLNDHVGVDEAHQRSAGGKRPEVARPAWTAAAGLTGLQDAGTPGAGYRGRAVAGAVVDNQTLPSHPLAPRHRCQ